MIILEYYTVRQVAKHLQLHTSTIYRYITIGKLPATKLGGQWRISEQQLQQMFENAYQNHKEVKYG